MPTDLDIDHKRSLKGTVALYADHMLIHTGNHDWPSRIEDDERYPLARNLKSLLKAEIIKQPTARPANVLVTNSSFTFTTPHSRPNRIVSLLKVGVHCELTEGAEQREIDAVVRMVATNTVTKESVKQLFKTSDISEILVLICGHAGRDSLCGVMGPLLQAEFETQFARDGLQVIRDPISMGTSGDEAHSASNSGAAGRIGIISHIGGHAFAGNVIIYIPTTLRFKLHPLQGQAVWYGRVEPRHVEGIVQQTVKRGVVIEELVRGVV